MIPLANYPAIPQQHPWHQAEQQRQQAITQWRSGDLDNAESLLIAAIRQTPQCPFTWSTLHRFLHEFRTQRPQPKDGVIVVPKSGPISQFSLYRFFDRCQSALIVAAKGWNGFEPPCPLILARWLRHAGGSFCDVGANSGYYTLLALAAGVERAIAVEPFAPAVDVLQSNIDLNNWTDRVEVRQCAVAETSGVAHLFLPGQMHGLLETSASQDPEFRREHSFDFEVEMVTLDLLIGDNRLAGELTIKVDVEGTGPTVAVLQGAKRLVRQKRPVMMVEYFEGPPEALATFLREMSYISYIATPDGKILLEQILAPRSDQLNHFFVPSEKAAAFLQVIGRAL